MRKFIIISIIVIFSTYVWAQAELEENTQQDTLNIEQAVPDTLVEKIDPKLLLVEMTNFLEEKRKIEDDLFIPHLIYKENFHLSSPFNLNMRITKNGFSEIPFATGNLQTVQNNRSIYKTIYKRGNIFYNSWEYSLPAALTETYMGLGDINMNNIAVSLLKGSIFGIPNFDMQLDFLGEKGKWLGIEDESSQNFHLHLSYDLDFAKIHFDNSIIDQELPSGKNICGYLGYMYPFYSTSNKEDEYSFKVENEIIDFGFKYLLSNYKMDDWWHKKRDLLQILFQKKLHSQNHNLDLSYEFISENITSFDYDPIQQTEIATKNNSYHIFSIDHDSNIFGFILGNTGYHRDDNKNQINSEISREIISGFSIFGKYAFNAYEYLINPSNTNFHEQSHSITGGGIMINHPSMKSKFTFGQHNLNGFQGKFYDIQNTFNLKIANNIYVKYELWLRNEHTDYPIEINSELLSYPKWQLFDNFEFTYRLEHNNAIKLGLKHIFHTKFSYYFDACESPTISDTQNIDAYLKIQLTDRFEISVDAINLTNNKIMFTNYNHPGTHFNFNVHWIFVN